MHPETPVVGDVFKLDANDVPDCDVLSFTTPCQSFSVAGKRLGFEDTRGTLVFEALRIAKEKRPKALFMENVKGLVNPDKGRTIDTILHAMNEVGYTVDFSVLNSKYFGVPQNRERVFIIGIRDDLIDPQEWNPVGNTMLPKAKRRLKEAGLRTFNFDWPEQSEVTKRLRDVLETQVDEKYYLSEDKTAKLVAELSELPEASSEPRINQHAQSGTRVREESGTLRNCLNHQHVIEGGIAECDSALENYRKFYDKYKYIQEMFNLYNCAEITDIAPTQTAQCTRINASSTVLIKEGLPIREAATKGYAVAVVGGGHREPKIAEEVRPVITPDRTDKRQNGRRFKEDGEEAFTCTAVDRHGVAIGEYPRYRIRKLTPRETMRLQGFPESATDTLYAEGFSDSRIYKFSGNAVTTAVIKALGERLAPYLNEVEAK